MDARAEAGAIPLAVDLDGTLIASDLLWEGLFLLLRQKPHCLFLLPFWLAAGKARLKCEIANRVAFDAAALPYREAVLDRLKAEKATGRKLVLATAAPRPFAEAVALHLGIFDAVMCTEPGSNLSSTRKRDALIANYGDGGFDYVGNSKADLAVFDAARTSIVVAPDRHAARWQREHGSDLIEADRPTVKTLLKMLRVHQWLKNSLIAVPLILSHQYLDVDAIVAFLLAFVSFSAAASAIYILNDFMDLALDRRHPTKRNRPFASGALSIPFGLGAMAVLMAVSFSVALLLPPLFMLVLVGYLIATTAYSLSLKRMLLIDVLTLAGLYAMRILAGGVATQSDFSFWLLAFSIFFFLSLALVKRYVELRGTELPAGERIAGRGYRAEDQEMIGMAGMAAAFTSALVLALFIDAASLSDEYTRPWLIWPLAPIVLYITMRVWILARRDEMHDDPIVFIIRDWRSQLVAGFGAVLLIGSGL